MCHFWHAGVVDVPGVFGCLAPVKGKWLCFALWQLAKDFDLFMFQVGQENCCLNRQVPEHSQQVMGKQDLHCSLRGASSLLLYVKSLAACCHQVLCCKVQKLVY